MKKAILLSAVMMLGLGNLAQAKDGTAFDINTIHCHGFEIDLQSSTVTSKGLGLDRVTLKMSVGSDKYERVVLRGSAPGITLAAAPDQKIGWSGNSNSKITINGKTTFFECNVD